MTEKQSINKSTEPEALNNCSSNPIECIIDPGNNSPVILDTDNGPEVFSQIALITVPEKALDVGKLDTQDDSAEIAGDDSLETQKAPDDTIHKKNEPDIPHTEKRRNGASGFFRNCFSRIFGGTSPVDKKRNDAFSKTSLSESALAMSGMNPEKINLSAAIETESNTDPDSGEKCRIFAILRAKTDTESCNSLYIFEITESEDRISLINIVDEQLFSLVLIEYFKCIHNTKSKN